MPAPSPDEERPTGPDGDIDPRRARTGELTTLRVTNGGAVASGGSTVTILGAVAAGRDVHIGQVTVVADDGPPVGDQAGRPGAVIDRCPYPGLDAFGPGDADLFFGRDADLHAVLGLIDRAGMVTLVGSSGSGKSSLLAAAVIPAAQTGRAPSHRQWNAVMLRPGPEPLAMLTAAIRRQAGSDPTASGGPPTLWVIDQFEEAFDPAVGQPERQSFLDELMTLATEPGAHCVLLSLRSDFYAALDKHPRLARAVTGVQHRLVPLDLAALEAAVVQPAELVGLRVEAALVTAIRQEMTANPAALPLLGYALRQTWRRRRNGWLTLTGYVEAGGIGRALQDGAQRAWAQLPAPRQDTARRLLLRLSHLDEDGIAVRRRRPVADLVTDLDDVEAVTFTINSLATARLLTVSEGADGRPEAEITHESLLAEWSLLRDWLREDRVAARVRDDLIMAAQAWIEHDKDPGYLLPAPRLAAVQALSGDRRLSMTATERRFLLDSRQRARRQQRARRLLPALAALMVIASLVALLAVSAQRQADRDRRTAQALQAAAVARSVLSGQRDLGALLALAAYRSHPDPTTFAALIDATASPDGPLAYTRPAPFANALGPMLTADHSSVVGLADGRIALLPPEGSGQLRYLTGHPHAVSAIIGVGPGVIASAGLYGAVRVHRLDEPQRPARFTIPKGPVTALAADPTRNLLIAAVGTKMYRLSLSEQARHWPVLSAPTTITDLVVDPKTNQTVAATRDGSVLRWQTSTGRALSPLADSPAGKYALAVGQTRLAMSPQGRLAAVDGERLHVWSRLDGSPPKWSLSSGARSVLWVPTGGQLLVGDVTGAVTAWAWQPSQSPLRLGARYRGLAPATAQEAPGARLATNGQQLVGLDAQGTVVRWQLGSTTSPALSRLSDADGSTSGGAVQAVAWSSTGMVAAGDRNGSVTLVAADGQARPILKLAETEVSGLVWRSPTSLAVGTGDGAVYSMNETGGERKRIADPRRSKVVGLAAAGADRIAVLTASGELRIVSAAGTLLTHRNFPPDAHALAVSPGGAVAVATGDAKSTVITLDPGDGSEIRTLRGHLTQVDSLAFSPDGSQLASGSDDHTIRLWSTRTGRLEGELSGHTDMIQALLYSADATMLASSGQDGTVRLWSVPAAAPLGEPLADSAGYVPALAVSPDGSRLVAANGAGLDIWPFTSDGWARTACALAGRDLRPAEWSRYAPGLTPHRLCP